MPFNTGRCNWHFEGCAIEGRYNGLEHLHELVVPAWWDSMSYKGVFQPVNIGWGFQVPF